MAQDVSPDGRFIAFTETNPQRGEDIYFLNLYEDNSEIPVLTNPENEGDPSFSPDGHFLAYASDKTERSENTRPHFRPFDRRCR